MRFVASSLISVVECWIERGARETPQQVQAIFAELLGPDRTVTAGWVKGLLALSKSNVR